VKPPYVITEGFDTPKVTRFEVIDHRKAGLLELPGGGPVRGVQGRVFATDGVSARVVLRDDGRTLCVYLSESADG
jgi:hypothetical protein